MLALQLDSHGVQQKVRKQVRKTFRVARLQAREEINERFELVLRDRRISTGNEQQMK